VWERGEKKEKGGEERVQNGRMSHILATTIAPFHFSMTARQRKCRNRRRRRGKATSSRSPPPRLPLSAGSKKKDLVEKRKKKEGKKGGWGKVGGVQLN